MTSGSQFTGRDMREVVLVGAEGEKGRVRVQSVELYGDGVIVRWWAQHRRLQAVQVNITLQDDEETAYTLKGGGARGNTTGTRGEAWFTPPVPAGASLLTIGIDSRQDAGRFTVDVPPRYGERPDSA